MHYFNGKKPITKMKTIKFGLSHLDLEPQSDKFSEPVKGYFTAKSLPQWDLTPVLELRPLTYVFHPFILLIPDN
jgi:hypothetical protein